MTASSSRDLDVVQSLTDHRNLVKSLTEEEFKEIDSIGESQNVKLLCREGVIRFEGRADKVSKAITDVKSILEEKQKEFGIAQILVELTAQWNYRGMSGNEKFLEQYDDRTNLVIERAYQAGHREVKLADLEGVESVVKFDEMVEYINNEAQDKVKVIRTDLAGSAGGGRNISIPKNWTTMTEGQNLQLVTLNSSDKEYQDVAEHFISSLGRKPNIIKIERIQNVRLDKSYLAKKNILHKIKQSPTEERILWHGTDVNTVDTINNYGFSRSYLRKNCYPTSLGNGVYFSVNSFFYDRESYTPTDPSGHRRMYRVRVLTGEYKIGNSDLRFTPLKSRNPNIFYESVTNNVHNPTIFMVFQDSYSCPEHVITYQ